MGWVEKKHGLWVNESEENANVEQHFKPKCFASEFEFSINWSWLMPVVDKIESLGYWTELCSGVSIVFGIGFQNNSKVLFFSERQCTTKIDHVYSGVIQFILHYNLKKNEQGN